MALFRKKNKDNELAPVQPNQQMLANPVSIAPGNEQPGNPPPQSAHLPPQEWQPGTPAPLPQPIIPQEITQPTFAPISPEDLELIRVSINGIDNILNEVVSTLGKYGL